MSVRSGVPARSLFDLLLRHRADPLGFLVRCAREDGDIVTFEMAGRRLLVISSPDLVQEVLVRRSKEFWKAHVFETDVVPWGKAILGRGLLVSEGESWLRQRRLMQQAFHRARIDAHAGIAAEATRALIAKWSVHERDIHADMSRLTLEILARALFGRGEGLDVLHAALRGVFDHRQPTRGLLYLVPEWVPTPANRHTRRALRDLDTVLMDTIAERRRRDAPEGDLLGLLLDARDENGQGFDDRFVRDELVSTIVAGQDTLAATLTWALDTLASRPDLTALLRAELAPRLRGDHASAGRLDELPLLRGVVREVLRMFPPGKNIVRVAAADCEVAGGSVPRGTFLVMSQWVIHRDPRWYEAPERFDPARWDGDLATRIPRFAYFPFGGGPRLCLGAAFAEMGLQVVISLVVQHRTLDGDRARRQWDMARLRPRAGLWLTPTPVAS